VKELVENYGKIDVLWYDGGEDTHLAHRLNLNKYEVSRERTDNYRDVPPIPEFWGEYELDELVRSRQPHIVINNRLGMRRCGDYTTPERKVGEFNPKQPWETCDTLSETWGWTPGCKVLSLERIIHMLIEVVTGGGNLLLNVAPMGDGSLEKAHEARLLEVGAWLEAYGEAIYGTRTWRKYGEGPTRIVEGQFSDGIKKRFTPEDIRFTTAGGYLYAIILRCAEDGEYRIASLAEQDASRQAHFHGIIRDVEALGAFAPVSWKRDESGLHIRCDMKTKMPVVMKIKVD
jgi:alpha-L-fucosidase